VKDDGVEQARRLTAVVVTFNRLEKLQATVLRLLESSPDDLERLVVVDNASNDGTGNWLSGMDDPRLEVLSMAQNLGGAGGFEAGMRHAVARFDPDWLVLMDDDGRPAPGALAAFQGADLSGWDAVAAAVYFPDGRICEMNRPSRNPFWHRDVLRATFLGVLRGRGRSGFHLAPSAYAEAAQQVDVASFVGLFLSRAAIQRAGYPDGSLFVYGEDGLYTLRLSGQGGRIGFLPAIRFEHDCSTLAGDHRFRPLWKVYYYHRNLLFLYRASAGAMFWPALFVVLPKWVLKARHHRGERIRFLRLIGLAVAHGLRRRTGVDHARILRLSEGANNAGSETKRGSDTA